ncbi:enolase 4 isoform X1 [Synchiropus splendidus]|uniref:enolase 4 isoform X1 n=1 Tax=Synchiropus splendidus TaxID=270530 RepID=UPI00237D814C|nr:enolase 4 isoform X1 [Synchiropus splendidus]XP_053731480.1 enolase 4 isoform X1 [Synchiropus splendidus]XP_053731481.1 enolase 4 isoform X1 [Synchiropus splendidus]XP_053731482.1 enolase 4 isoform X1 [Synchiropus splendidus]XP_053731483.1 enolase 4 isoform X1 [Synchiropus splendidus]XP_053731484.1 enolase 4 isoform X1 [Synchiropus splendidus]XP_053731485.1 enolase 4 isoform X1 [Synchiropus splendidus]XP_053731487.1 enolase 4 isoform X1 [Synchiropus splendidus]
MSSCPSSEDVEFYALKTAAVQFYRNSKVPQEIERALNELFYHQPEDRLGFLANYFSGLSTPVRISKVRGREVFDVRGQLVVEAQVFCIVRNKEKRMSSASILSHFPLTRTFHDLNAQCDERLEHVTTAVQWINGALNDMLKGRSPCDQTGADSVLSKFFLPYSTETIELTLWPKEESVSHCESEMVPSTPVPTKEKKCTDRKKKCNSVEKPILPPEPPKPAPAGSMAIGSLSLALAKAGAEVQERPLYKYIASLKNPEAETQFHIPVPLITILSCGKNSHGKVSLFEEVILVPKPGQQAKQAITTSVELQREVLRIINNSTKSGAAHPIHLEGGLLVLSFERLEHPLDLINEASANLGLTLGVDVYLALNCAAFDLMDYSKGKYEISTGTLKTPDELVEFYRGLISKFPAVVALIDPFRREDPEQWEKLSHATGHTCVLLSEVSHDLQSPLLHGAAGYVLRYMNEMTISDLLTISVQHHGAVIMGSASCEPCGDDCLADLAVGLGLDYIKMGGLSSAEKMTKYNRLISIEEELAQEGILASRESHPPPLCTEAPPEESASPDTD